MRRLGLVLVAFAAGAVVAPAQEPAAGECARILEAMNTSPGEVLPASARSALAEGICLCKANQWALAGARLRPYAETHRRDAAAWYWLGEAEFYQRHFPAAREALDRASALNPNSAEYFRALGEVELELRNNDAAYHAWLKANRLKPGDARTLYYLGRLFFEADFLDEAAAWFRQALAADKNDYRSMTYLAMCAERLDFMPTALALYQRAIAESKRQAKPYAWAYLNLAKHYREGGEEPAARTLLEEAERLCPEANALTALAQMVAASDAPRAEKLLRRAIALDAALPDAHYRLSLLLRASGQTEQAQREMDQFLAAKEAAERAKNTVQAIRR